MWIVLGIVSCSAVLWFQYIGLKDKDAPEPPLRLVQAFGLGLVAAALAMAVFEVLDRVGVVPVLEGADLRTLAIGCFGFIGPIEEGAKVAVALLVAFRWKEFDEYRDGFVYASAIGIGFATLENIHHLPGLPVLEQAARTVTLPITHSLFGAVWGLGLARARFKMGPGWRRHAWGTGSVLLAMALHGLYDLAAMTGHGNLVSAAIVLVIWMVVLVRLRRGPMGAAPGPHSPH